MHALNIATVLLVNILVGVELSVSAFVNPAAWRLEPDAQLKMLGRFALVLGRVMPVWYPVCTLLLGLQTWLHWHAPGLVPLLMADLLWVATSLASIFFLVPLNRRVIEGATGWQELHHTWDGRHRLRIAALAIAAVLLTGVLVC